MPLSTSITIYLVRWCLKYTRVPFLKQSQSLVSDRSYLVKCFHFIRRTTTRCNALRSDTSLTVTACDWTNYTQPRDNVARNRTCPIQETRCMRRETRSHERCYVYTRRSGCKTGASRCMQPLYVM